MSNFIKMCLRDIEKMNISIQMKQYLKSIYLNFSFEIQVNYICNLSCIGCNRFLDIDKDHTPLRNINPYVVRRILAEIDYLDIKLHHIQITGGEPTLHPQIYEIIKDCLNYQKKYHDCIIKFTTNGYSDKTKEFISRFAQENIIFYNSKKTKEISDTDSFYSHAVYLPEEGRQKENNLLKACCLKPSTECGTHLDYQGLYLCHFAAVIDKYFHKGLAQKYIFQMFPLQIFRQIETACVYCGHLCFPTFSKSFKSETWIKAIKQKISNNKI